jgi:hypothetical protein
VLLLIIQPSSWHYSCNCSITSNLLCFPFFFPNVFFLPYPLFLLTSPTSICLSSVLAVPTFFFRYLKARHGQSVCLKDGEGKGGRGDSRSGVRLRARYCITLIKNLWLTRERPRLSCFHSSMPVPLALEQQVAIAAVRRACALTTTVFNKLVAGETLVKGDKSPVTGTNTTYLYLLWAHICNATQLTRHVWFHPSSFRLFVLFYRQRQSGRLCVASGHQYRPLERVPR